MVDLGTLLTLVASELSSSRCGDMFKVSKVSSRRKLYLCTVIFKRSPR